MLKTFIAERLFYFYSSEKTTLKMNVINFYSESQNKVKVLTKGEQHERERV